MMLLMNNPWWRHQMKAFSALLALCARNSPVTGEFPSQRPVARGFDVFFDLLLNIRLSKQSRRRWFETHLRLLWRQCNTLKDCAVPIHMCYVAWPRIWDEVTGRLRPKCDLYCGKDIQRFSSSWKSRALCPRPVHLWLICSRASAYSSTVFGNVSYIVNVAS